MSKAVANGHLDVRLFGHLEVALDGGRFSLATPRKTLQVLAYLLLHRAAPVSRDYLAFLLYPDDEEAAARAKLRATLSELAKVLPAPAARYVSIETDKVAWNPAADLWLDVDAFEKASNDRSHLAEAIELYRGDLLPELYDEWLDAIRERYRNVYLRCLTERISEARRHADLALAIETARKVLAIDPWREDIVRRIIAMRFESGDRAGALSEYNAFAKRLRAEMNTEPMAETAAVAERITRGQMPAQDESEGARIAFAAPSTILPFIDRRHEIERLLEMWSRAARGRGACAFVAGEPGIGKSRLVAELAHAVEDRGGRVLVGATSSPEAIPYECVVDALRSALPLLTSLKPNLALASIAALIPEIHARVALPQVPGLDGESERIRLLESLFRCVADLSAPRPLLLIVEDLHWAQPTTIELLQFLVRRIAGLPIMIVGTYRDEETPRVHALHALRREARSITGAQSLWLSRFSAADIEELRTALPDLRDRPAESLIAASNGNPLFLTQVVVEVREGEPAAVPSSLQEVVGRRLERLSDQARAAAAIAACIGDRFSRDVIRDVSAWDENTLTEALDELLDRRIIREAAARGFLEYAFAHQLVREVVAQSIPPKDAAARRRRIARVLEELYPERFSELAPLLAAHYQAAGDAANAARCYLEAVRWSISIGALSEARTLCERALACDADLRARAELLLQSATIESRCGNRESRSAALSALESVDAELGDPEIHRAMLLQQMEFAAAIGDRAMHERAASALEACVPEDDAMGRVELHLAEAKMAFTLGRLAESYTAGSAALSASRAAQDEAGATRALCALAMVEAHRGHLSTAEALFDEAADAATRAADPQLEQLAVSSGWTIAYQQRDLQRCRSLGQRCLELAIKLGDRPAEAQAHGRLGVTLSVSGTQYAQARRHYAAASRIFAETGRPVGSAGPLLNEALLEMKLGFFERATSSTEKALHLFEDAGDDRGRAGALNNLVFLRAATGRHADAHHAAKLGTELARRHGFGLLEAAIQENLAFAEALAGNYARAIELIEPTFEMRRRSESEVWSSTALSQIAIWHAALGNLPAARDAVQRLLADEDAILRTTDWPSYCYWTAAQVLHLDGLDEEATRALARARRLMEENAKPLEPEDRAQFLSLPWHVDLTAAASDGVWPSPPR